MPQLAHDVHNAIAPINGFADILPARLSANEPARACAEPIKTSGTYATALVKTLMPPDESSPAAPTPNPGSTAQVSSQFTLSIALQIDSPTIRN
jgi:hypothetical protein